MPIQAKKNVSTHHNEKTTKLKKKKKKESAKITSRKDSQTGSDSTTEGIPLFTRSYNSHLQPML